MRNQWYQKTHSAHSDVASRIRIAGQNLLKAFETNDNDNKLSTMDGNYLNIILYIN